jgi:hypothetical protein
MLVRNNTVVTHGLEQLVLLVNTAFGRNHGVTE